MDNTVIVFTSDHGEELGDHYMFRKCRPYEGSCHIPLILSGPKPLIGGKEGQVCHNVVELRDLMPTFLDLAHAPVPEEVDGKSILPMVKKRRKAFARGCMGNICMGRNPIIILLRSGINLSGIPKAGKSSILICQRIPENSTMQFVMQNIRKGFRK